MVGETNIDDVTLNKLLVSDLLTREQLAKAMNVSVRTVDRWHRMRTGPPRIAVGRQRLYRSAAVRAWLETNEVNFGQMT